MSKQATEGKASTMSSQRMTCEHCGSAFIRGGHYICRGSLVMGYPIADVGKVVISAPAKREGE